MSLPSKVTSKLPRSLLSASRVTVMVLPAFAKLSPEELAILSEFIGIGFTAYTVTVLVTELAHCLQHQLDRICNVLWSK